LNIPVKVPIGECFGLVFWFWFTWHVEWSVNLCSLVSAFHRMKTLFRWSRLVVSFCILLSDWFFFLASDWLIGRKLWLLYSSYFPLSMNFYIVHCKY
jgi:hypothetical protein